LARDVLSRDVDQVRAALLRLLDDRAPGASRPDQPAVHPAAGERRLETRYLQHPRGLLLLGHKVSVERPLFSDPEHVNDLYGGIGPDELRNPRDRLVIDAAPQDRDERRRVSALPELGHGFPIAWSRATRQASAKKRLGHVEISLICAEAQFHARQLSRIAAL